MYRLNESLAPTNPVVSYIIPQETCPGIINTEAGSGIEYPEAAVSWRSCWKQVTTHFSGNKLGEIQIRQDVARLHIPEEGCWKMIAESWAKYNNSQRENFICEADMELGIVELGLEAGYSLLSCFATTALMVTLQGTSLNILLGSWMHIFFSPLFAMRILKSLGHTSWDGQRSPTRKVRNGCLYRKTWTWRAHSPLVEYGTPHSKCCLANLQLEIYIVKNMDLDPHRLFQWLCKNFLMILSSVLSSWVKTITECYLTLKLIVVYSQKKYS